MEGIVEKIIIVVCLACTAIFSYISFSTFQEKAAQRRASAGTLLSLSAASISLSEADRVLGERSTGYKIVEFGDYECPPCRALTRKLETLDVQRLGLTVYFKQFPLTQLHPAAMDAAILAETAKQSGHFKEMHALLMTHDLDSESLKGLAAQVGLSSAFLSQNRASSIESIQQDQTLGRLLGVHGTPSLILIRPDGSLVLLSSLDALSLFMNT